MNGFLKDHPDIIGGGYNLYVTPDADETMTKVWKEKRPQDEPFILPVLILDDKPTFTYETIEKTIMHLKK